MTYAALTGLFLIPPVLVTTLAVLWRRPGRHWWLTTTTTVATLVLLTIVFDNVMIAADLFRYEESRLLGWKLALVPVEDLGWPIAAGLLLPSLWILMTPTEDQ